MSKPRHFMVYFPAATADGEKYLRLLRELFGETRVYQLNGSGAYVVKVAADVGYQAVMDKIGFNDDQKRTGVLIEFDNTNVNGWYSQALWSFIGEGLK